MRNHDNARSFSRRGCRWLAVGLALLALAAAASPARAQFSNQTNLNPTQTNTNSNRYPQQNQNPMSSRSNGRNQQNRNSNPFSDQQNGSSRGGSSRRSSRNRSRTQDANGKNTETNGKESRRGKKKDEKKDDGSAQAQTPGRAAPQEKSNVANQRRKNLAQQKSPGGKGKSKDAASVPAFVFSPLITTPTLYFSPGEARTEPNRRFATPLFFFNPEQKPVDAIDLWVRYPVGLLSVVDMDLSPLNAAGGNAKREAAPDGYVHVVGRFDPPLKQIIVPLGSAQWRSGGELGSGSVRFETPEGGSGVGVFCDGANLIDQSAIGNVGLASLDFQILTPEEENDGGDDAPIRVAEFEQPRAILDPSTRPGVSLALNPRDETVRPGGTSTMDVAVLNPSGVKFDELRFRIRFNPDEVEILDADENNAVTDGVNIYDGGFRRAMPFDVRSTNRVNQSEGEIAYEAFNSAGVYAYPTGTVARIAFRLKPGAESATFRFEGQSPTSGGLVSDARALGASVLDNHDGRPADALYNARVRAADRM